MTDKQIQPSPALAKWFKKRQQAIELKKSIRKSGGHMMLKSTAVNPYKLDEPLRAEAVAYLEEQRRIQDYKSP